MNSFNLIDEPWIPCIDRSGSLCELGIRDALMKSHDLEGIIDASPLVTAALHRFLLALLHRVFGPKDLDEWYGLFKSGAFVVDRLDEYFSEWKDRFDIFHPEKPFYQSLDEEVVSAPKHPLSKLAQELASGNNSTLFDHSNSNAPVTWKPKTAAKNLIAIHLFAVGGGVAKPFNFSHGACVRGAIVLLRGESLFSTLCLNLIGRYGDGMPESIPSDLKHDLPSWEMDSAQKAEKRQPRGYLDFLTCPSRRIKLVLNEDGDVESVCIQQGIALQEGSWLDPMQSYSKDPKKGWIAWRFKENRAVWRDSSVLLHHFSDIRKPADTVLSFKNAVFEFPEIETTLKSVSLLGFKPDDQKAAKINLWRHESLPLPAAYLKNESAVTLLESQLALAEDVANALRNKALWPLASQLLAPYESSDRSPDKDSVRKMVNGFPGVSNFWSALEPAFYDLYLTLPKEEDQAVEIWNKALWDAAVHSLELTLRGLDGSARSLQAAVKARSWLYTNLNKLLINPYAKSEQEEVTANV